MVKELNQPRSYSWESQNRNNEPWWDRCPYSSLTARPVKVWPAPADWPWLFWDVELTPDTRTIFRLLIHSCLLTFLPLPDRFGPLSCGNSSTINCSAQAVSPTTRHPLRQWVKVGWRLRRQISPGATELKEKLTKDLIKETALRETVVGCGEIREKPFGQQPLNINLFSPY